MEGDNFIIEDMPKSLENRDDILKIIKQTI